MIIGGVFALPIVVGFVLFFAAPFLASLYYCFTKGLGGTEFVGLENFIHLIESDSFRLATANTVKFIFISVPVIIMLALILALLLNRKGKDISCFKTFFILPLVIPVASVILFWNIVFDEYGILNGILSSFVMWQPIDWLNTGWSFYILVTLYVWKNCGYNIILFLAGLNNIPEEYYEAARIDGGGRLICFFKITVPFLIPTGFFVFIISIINSFKVFREAYLIAGNYPYFDIYMLQHFMNNNFQNLNYQRLSTAAFLMMIVVFILVFILFRFENKISKNLQN